MVNDCYSTNVASSSRTDYTGSTTVFAQSIVVSPPTFMGTSSFYHPTQNSQGWFDVKWTVSRAVYKFTYFVLDLSWLGQAQATH